jgi:hypothetical protein
MVIDPALPLDESKHVHGEANNIVKRTSVNVNSGCVSFPALSTQKPHQLGRSAHPLFTAIEQTTRSKGWE